MTGEVTSAVGLDDPTLSYNLGTVTNYSAEMAFIDIFKTAHTWIGHEDGWGGMNYAALQAGGYLDENGWVTEIPEGFEAVGTVWDWDTSDSAADGRAGVYVLEYEGEGTIELRNVDVISQEPGRIVFNNENGGTIILNITETDPNGTGDYIKDITVVAEEHVELHEAGAVFSPEFLDLIDDSRELRFMDWMRTNGSEQSSWEDRPEETDAFWSTGAGVPLEVMVQLANELGVDPWFTIPHMADDAYVQEFATYVKEHLDPDLTVYVEYTNEAWNGALPAYDWMAEQSLAEWGVADPTAYYAKRATEVAVIWEEVYGADADAQLNNVLASQTTNDWISNRMLAGHVWKEQEPDTFVDPSTVFDSLAITTYFGSSTVSSTKLRNELLEAIYDPNVDATTFLAEKLMDPDYGQSIPQIIEYWNIQAAIAEEYGVDLIAYEGGQHVQHSFAIDGLTDDDLDTLTEFLSDFVRSGEMADLYQVLWDSWAEVSDGSFMQFGAVSKPRETGSWGTRSSLDDETPRSALLDVLNQTTDSWWGAGANSAYQHGVQTLGTDADETILGTIEEDYLAGAGGNDILNGGAGDDGINGGAGDDIAVFSGNAQDYTITAEGAGYRVDGADGSDFVINVESFRFDGDVDISLADFLAGNLPIPALDDAGAGDAIDAQGTFIENGERVYANESTAPVGAYIMAISSSSSLGQELGLDIGSYSNGYVVGARTDRSLIESVATQQTDGRVDAMLSVASIAVDAEGVAGTTGRDVFVGGDMDDGFYGMMGSDFIRGMAGSDTLSGGGGHDSLRGGSGADVLDGGNGDDGVRGGNGADTLLGGAGNNILYGGNGADTFVVGLGRDQLIDFTDDDLLDLTALGLGTDANVADYAATNGSGHLEISNGSESVVLLGLDESDLSWISMLT